MNYKPQCDSCKHFVTTDKTPKAIKSKRFRTLISGFYSVNGICTKSYCVKEKKQAYRKNMR